MKEIVLKYDVLCIFEDRYEFRRISEKPFFEKFKDVFFVKNNLIFLVVLLFLILVLHLFSINAQMIIQSILSFIMSIIVFQIAMYYERHKDRVILKESIRNLVIAKKAMSIKFHDNERERIKVVDLPDDVSECYGDVCLTIKRMIDDVRTYSGN